MRPEERAVIMCALGSETLDIPEMRDSLFDWAFFFGRCQDEGVLALAYRMLFRPDGIPVRVPADIRERFEEAYYTFASYNTILYQKVSGILAEFKKKHIDVISLKGVFLSEKIYGNIALRPMTDMDLLVREADIEKAEGALASLGYSAPGQLDNYRKAGRESSINSIMYRSRDLFCPPVHLHWHLVNSTWPVEHWARSISMKKIWDNAETVLVGGRDILCLNKEHLIIYLSQHCLMHSISKLILLRDIYAVLRFYDGKIDWRVLRREAGEFDQLSTVYYVLTAVSAFFGYKIPEFQELRPKRIGFAGRVISRLIRNGARGYLLFYTAIFFMLKGWEQIRFILRTFFPARYVMAHNLSLPADNIKISHYVKRIVRNVYGFTPLNILFPLDRPSVLP